MSIFLRFYVNFFEILCQFLEILSQFLEIAISIFFEKKGSDLLAEFMYFFVVFCVLSTVSPCSTCTTGLKALFDQADCTSIAQLFKLLTFPKLKDRGSRMTIYQSP